MKTWQDEVRAETKIISVVCPKCCAAIGAKCLEPNPIYGQHWIDTFHQERVAKANEA